MPPRIMSVSWGCCVPGEGFLFFLFPTKDRKNSATLHHERQLGLGAGGGVFSFFQPKRVGEVGGFRGGGVEGCGGQEALCGKCHQHEMFADPYADTHPPTDAHDGPHPA